MNIALSVTILYLGCVVAYHADVRRSMVPGMQALKSWRVIGRILVLMSFGASLYLIAEKRGWEVGIPIWLGLLTFCGIASLLLVTLRPARHLQSGIAAVLLISLLSLGNLII